MVVLPRVGPLELPCSRTLDEWLGQKPPSALGRCGKLACEFCASYALTIEVAATARVLDENGGRAIVCTLHEVPLNLAPEDLHALVEPRMATALDVLQAKYVGGLEARWTLEQDAQGRANLHVLGWGPSKPKIGTLRRTFDAADLGRHVEMEDVSLPISMACYTTKIALASFAVSPKGRRFPLAHSLRFNGGAFARTTEAFYGDSGAIAGLEAFAEPYTDEVIAWATHWKQFPDKIPPSLKVDLAEAGAGLLDVDCQSALQESADDDDDLLFGPWGLELPPL